MEPLEQWFVLSGYVRFHQWLGFQPYRLDGGHFCGVVANLSLIIYRRHCILYHCESIGMIVDVIKLLTILLANLIIYGELFRTVGNVCNLWKALYRAHRTLESQGMLDRRQLARTIRLYWLFVIGSFAYLVVNELYSYFSARLMQTKRFYMYFFGLQYLLHVKLQQLIYPTLMLEFYLQMTHTALDHHVELLQCSERLGSTRYLEFLAGKINILKRLHSELFQASVELNEAFGWTYLSIYWKCYIHVLSNSYWVVFWILKDQIYHAARIINPLLIRTLFIAVMFCVNSRVKNASDRIRHRLHRIDLGIQTTSKPLFTMIFFTVGAYITIFIQQVLAQVPEVECSKFEAHCGMKLW
uniref:Gustatory receptor n=1 Tax=Anopheles culicifacies TaxID=139723 RepID=A0A182M0U0_9DIPT